MSIEIRAFSRGDIPAVVSLWNATMVSDPVSEQRLLMDFVLDPHFNADSFLLAVNGDDLVGFVLGLSARSDLPSDNAVGTGVVVGIGIDERYRRQGVGTLLLKRLEQRWQQSGIERVQIGPWIPTYLTPGVDERAYPGAIEFLASLGYTTGPKPVSMRALLTGYEPAAGVEETATQLELLDVSIRPAVSDDAIELLSFAREHFAHWEAYIREALRAVVSANGACTLHIALDGERVIGFAMTNGERFGPFGVNSDYRGRGIGAVLLARALCAMRAANVHLAYFLWTSDQTARLYNRHGFEIVRRFTMMSKSPLEKES